MWLKMRSLKKIETNDREKMPVLDLAEVSCEDTLYERCMQLLLGAVYGTSHLAFSRLSHSINMH